MTPLETRQAAAARYKPRAIDLLIVAEAPPCDPGRYFYFEDVRTHDWLFRYTWQGLTGAKPSRADKPAHLAALRDSGVYLIDLHEDAIAQPKASHLAPHVPGLIRRATRLNPKSIVLIKHSVHDAAYTALAAAGLPVIDERIPFPSSGQQKRFLESFARALEHTGINVRP